MVTIYTTSSCHFCHEAKEFFQKNNVEYTEKNVETDEAARDEMLNKTHQMGVPVIDIDGTIIVGFDKGAITQALGASA
ncbi:MAG: NrdH-redoxin [Candidatus Spechtbacteria bacterium SB0662_bin_43]|uniref:NrdH-redoxin n=1 Tax=Candidatus Spechtbacteria bacterium SB0662_bin_43 TaxID=2604897 RepID=A0A845D974_9BACT|nr:NrdH-redoxin [Candidatus Spechtbacteria bacterium SB0662_bin_43]